MVDYDIRLCLSTPFVHEMVLAERFIKIAQVKSPRRLKFLNSSTYSAAPDSLLRLSREGKAPRQIRALTRVNAAKIGKNLPHHQFHLRVRRPIRP